MSDKDSNTRTCVDGGGVHVLPGLVIKDDGLLKQRSVVGGGIIYNNESM